MTNSSTQNDTISIAFINPATGQTVNTIVEALTQEADPSVGSVTQINMEKNFFTPANGLTFVIEDDRVVLLVAQIARGYKVKVSINGNINFIGYIFDYHLSYSRHGGTQLSIQCKDLLGYLEQGIVPPNMGTNNVTNFHFKPTDTLQYALTTIINAFNYATDNQAQIQVLLENADSLTFASGFNVGLRVKGKTPKARSASITASLDHLTTPQKGESYLAYMLRLAKHRGCNIKMADDKDNVVYVKPPTYERDQTSPFKLIHYITPPNTINNNVLDGSLHFSLDKQPSVVIMEANSTGDGKFYQSNLKGIALNELTAYNFANFALSSMAAGTFTPPDPIKSVNDVVSKLTTGNLGTGYKLAPFNKQLFLQRASLAVDIDTQVSMPYYSVDYNAHTGDEISFASSKFLSEQQDKYVEFRYRVQGWTMPGTNYVWQPDMLVSVTEELLRPGGTINSAFADITMWIKQVNFIKSRNGGTETEIICSLPYTHNFEITQ